MIRNVTHRPSTLSVSPRQREHGWFDPIPAPVVEQSIGARFESQVEQFGDHTAVSSDGMSVTYAQLNAVANRLACRLIDRFSDRGPTIGLLVEQGASTAAAMIGCLKAGAAFVPLDPTYPASRIRFMLKDSGASLLLTNEKNTAQAKRVAKRNVPLMQFEAFEDDCDVPNPNLRIDSYRSAYVIYTSGSTGVPKGVIQSHRAALHNMFRHKLVYGITHEDRQTLLYPSSVAGGIRDTFNALLTGAGLYHYPVRERGLNALARWLKRNQITVYCSVATIFRHFAAQLSGRGLFEHLRVIKLGGEATHFGDIQLFKRHFHKNTTLFSGLASSETGLIRAFPIQHDTVIEADRVPLGYAVPGVEIAIVDERLAPVQRGDVGRIVVRCDYLTDGYRAGREIDDSAYRPDPAGVNERLYLTGDMGRLAEDDCLYHCGRADRQLKIHGHRVDMSEIERALLTCRGVREAAVLADEQPDSPTRIVACIVPEGFKTPTTAQLRQQLAEKLPAFMIPHAFANLTAMPLTPNGKVDREALPRPRDVTHRAENDLEPPRTDLEHRIAALWRNVLGPGTYGVNDGFFVSGGDSLAVIRLILEIERDLGCTVPVNVFYTHTTIRSLAAYIEQSDATGCTRTEAVPLRIGGNGPSFFCLPGRGGTVFSFRALAGHLPEEFNVYGLPLPGLGIGEEPISDMTTLAAEMIRLARQVSPTGPIYLMGYSFGGLVAFEMARQLRADGDEAPYLALIDTIAPRGVRAKPLHQRLAIHAKHLTGNSLRQRIRYAANMASNRMPPSPLTFLRDARTSGPVSRALHAMDRANQRARDGYRPGVYDGRIILLKASAQPNWRQFQILDETYGWNNLAAEVDLHTIPGEHLDFFSDSNLPAMMEIVRKTLRQSENKPLF